METTYEEFIQNILETRGRFACGEEYHERHHIIPKCLGGTNDEDNLIDLFAREHFIAHRLLALENPENDKMIYAWNMMSNLKKEDRQITAKEYEEVRIAFCKTISGENNPFYGKHHSEETREKMRKNHADFSGKNHPNYGISRYGKDNPNYGNRYSEETRRKISENHADMSGENNPMYGKTHSEDARIKMRNAKIGLYDRSNGPQAKKIIRLSDNMIYGCILDASEDNHMHRCTIRERCKAHKDFMYYDEWLTQQNDLENIND